MPAPLSWKFSVSGQEDVKSAIRDVRREVGGASDDTLTYAKSMRQQARDANAVIRTEEYKRRIFLAEHPQILKITRATHELASIGRTVLAIQNAYNLAMIATQGTSATMIGLLNERAQLERELANAQATGKSQEEVQKIKESINEVDAKIKELKNTEFSQLISTVLGVGSSIALIGDAAIRQLPRLAMLKSAIAGIGGAGSMSAGADALAGFGGKGKGIKGFLKGGGGKMIGGAALVGAGAYGLMSGGMDTIISGKGEIGDKLKAIGSVASIGIGSMLLGVPPQIALIGTAIAVAVTTILVFREELAKLFGWIIQALAPAGEAFITFFVTTLPDAFNTAGNAFFGFFTWISNIWLAIGTMITKAVGAIVKTITGMIENIISGVRKALEWLAKLPSNIAGGVVQAAMNFGNMITGGGKKAVGMDSDVSSPTLFLAGEAGTEHVSVTHGRGGSGGASGAMVININVAGSIWSEREISDKVLREMKTRLKAVGFT